MEAEREQVHTIITRNVTEGSPNVESAAVGGAGAAEAGAVDTSAIDAKNAQASEKASSDERAGLGGVAKAALVVVASLVAIGAGSVDLASKYATSTDQMAANANISIANANKIGDAFIATGGKTTFSAQEQMDAYAGVAGQLGLVAGHALTVSEATAIMTASQNLAEASGESLKATTSDVANILQIYGLGIKNAASVTDTLESTARVTGQSVDAVTNAMTKLKAGLGAAAPSVTEVGATLVDFQEHGETGRKGISAITTAMTTLIKTSTGVVMASQDATAQLDRMSPSLRNLSNEYAKGQITAAQYTADTKGLRGTQADLAKGFATAEAAVVTAQQKLVDMGITIDGADGKFVGMASVISQLHDKIQGETQAQQLATVARVFGATAAVKMLATIQAGPAAYDKATAAVTAHGSAAAAATKATDNFKGGFDKLKGAVEDIGIKLGQTLMPIVMTIMGDFTTAAPMIGQILVVAFHDLGVAVGIVVSVIGFIVSNFRIFGPLILAVVAGFVLFKTAMLVQSLIEGVTGAVAALSAIFGVLTGTTDAEAVALAGVDAAEVAAIAPIIAIVAAIALIIAIVLLVITHFKEIQKVVGQVWNDILSVIKTVVGAIGGFLSTAWNAISGVVKAVFGGIGAFFTTFWGDIMTGVGTFVGVLTTAWNVITNVISAPFKLAFAAVTLYFDIWKAVIKTAIGVVTGFFSGFASTVEGIFKGIVSAIGGIWSGITNAVKVPINAVIDVINFFIGGLDAIIGGINTALGIIPTFGLGKIQVPTIGKIPNLAAGAIVPATPGGMVVRVGEGGQDEEVRPLPTGGGSQGGTVTIINDFSGAFLMTEADMDRFIDLFGARFTQVHVPAATTLRR